MTYEEYLQEIQKAVHPAPQHRSHRDEEHKLQSTCVRWFRTQYPALRESLFAVPNGGMRNKATAARLKAEGVVPGVSDLLLLYPAGTYHALCIEMKTPKGRQSEAQKQWQATVEKAGYRYALCRTLDDFITTIKNYLPCSRPSSTSYTASPTTRGSGASPPPSPPEKR